MYFSSSFVHSEIIGKRKGHRQITEIYLPIEFGENLPPTKYGDTIVKCVSC